jgi:hypothetical protein
MHGIIYGKEHKLPVHGNELATQSNVHLYAQSALTCLDEAKLLAGLHDLANDLSASFSDGSMEVDDREGNREIIQ